jgi:glycosyltransferase involved in cell wall biosynthesis
MISMNEEGAVGRVVADIKRVLPGAEVLLVDSSSDRTPDIARAAGARVIVQLPPRGYGPAMEVALRSARNDIVITMDCDGTYPTQAIPELVRLIEQGCDLVNASRLWERPDAMPLGNYMANVTFALATRLIHGLPVTDVHSGMRAYRRSKLAELTFSAEGPALPVELLIKPAREGWRIAEVGIPYFERIGTSTLSRFTSTIWTLRRILRLIGTGHRVGRDQFRRVRVMPAAIAA